MAFEREWRDLAHLPRWSLARVNRHQSVAEHSYYVTLYSAQIAEQIEWLGDIGALVKYAMIHDAPELELGDIPANTKKVLAQYVKRHMDDVEASVIEAKFPNELTWFNPSDSHVKLIVRAADRLDAVMYICEEIQSGNQNMGTLDTGSTMLYHTDWFATNKGLPNNSILHRNLHRLADAWIALPHDDTSPEKSAEIGYDRWRNLMLPEIDRSYRGTSRRHY